MGRGLDSDRKIGDTTQESSLHDGNVSFFPCKEAHFYVFPLLAMTSLRNSWVLDAPCSHSEATGKARDHRRKYLHEIIAYHEV